jgi:hypothetical protein
MAVCTTILYQLLQPSLQPHTGLDDDVDRVARERSPTANGQKTDTSLEALCLAMS